MTNEEVYPCDVDLGIRSSAIDGRVNPRGMTFFGTIDLHSLTIQLNCVEEPSFMMRIHLLRINLFDDLFDTSKGIEDTKFVKAIENVNNNVFEDSFHVPSIAIEGRVNQTGETFYGRFVLDDSMRICVDCFEEPSFWMIIRLTRVDLFNELILSDKSIEDTNFFKAISIRRTSNRL